MAIEVIPDLRKSPVADARQRVRVSNPGTLFDNKQLHDKQPMFWDEETSGGSETSTHSTADAATTMTVTANGEYVIRQTKMRFNYQPGKSHLILQTFVLGAATNNVTKRIGYFNTSTAAPYTADIDGIYLKQDGTTQYLVQAKNGTETSVAQDNWNIDKFDGTGVSEITIDWAKVQIMISDFEWLGSGRVRIGFVIDGTIYNAHEFNNANSLTSVYMSSPSHSLRLEVMSDGGSDSIDHICSAVISEGGSDAKGVIRHVSTDGTHVDCAVENTTYAILGLRLKTTHLDEHIEVVDQALQIQTASNKIEWKVIMNPTVAGTFTYSDIADNGLQVATGATANTVTGGTTVAGGFLESGGQPAGGSGSEHGPISNALRIGAQIDGTRDTLVLCAKPIGGSSNVDVEGGITFRDIQ